MANVLTAITVIIQNLNSTQSLSSQTNTNNSANQAGQALEDYVKNAFADCISDDRQTQIRKLNATFSYLGNSHNPPDAVLRGSDAIEIKKLEKADTPQLQLNSSYPKDKLHSNNPKISSTCRTCESAPWEVKDMLYVIGHVNNRQLKLLFFVYGDLYCDDKGVYEGIESTIKDGLRSIDGVGFSDTKELGKVKEVDHLGITDLRIRGMWLIKSPLQHFSHLIGEEAQEFKLVALIPEDKYRQVAQTDIDAFEQFCEQNNVAITDVAVQNPKNPADIINTKSIIYTR